MKQKWNDHVYAFYVLLGLGLAPVTYREQIEYNALEESRIRTIPVQEHEGTAARY